MFRQSEDRPKILKAEFAMRAEKIQKLMREKDIDVFLAFGNETEPQFLRYLSDYWPSFESAAVMLLQQGEPVLLIGPESMTFALDRSVIPDIRKIPAFRESSNPDYPGHKLDTFASVLESKNVSKIKKVAIAGYNLMPKIIYDDFASSISKFGDVEIERGDDVMMQLRMYKSTDELECMRYAAKITSAAFDYVLENARVGMSELQLRSFAYEKIYELGAENEAYPMWFLAGEGSNQAISRPRHKLIKPGDLVHFQIGARYEGYNATIGRPVIFGKAEEWMTSAINAGYKAHDLLIESLYEGNNAGEIAAAYTDLMREQGYEDWLLYGPCHATGMMEGEPPWIESHSHYDLRENMCYCIDIFMGNAKGYGFRIEDSVKVGKTCAENLTNYKKEILIV